MSEQFFHGEEHGFPPKYDENYVTIAEWRVFLPIVSEPLPAYRFADELKENND